MIPTNRECPFLTFSTGYILIKVFATKLTERLLHNCLFLVPLVLAAGCQKSLPSIGLGSMSGGPSDGTTAFKSLYWTDSDKRKMISAVVWFEPLGLRVQGAASSGGWMIVHGHKISIDARSKAVYALQPDYTLKLIPLCDEELAHILNIFEDPVSPDGGFKFKFDDDPVWQSKVRPHMQVIPTLEVRGRGNPRVSDTIISAGGTDKPNRKGR